MIDWHTHILPGMDDGSTDTAESVRMLERLSSEGVGTVIATSHFYANDESVEEFLERRARAYELLAAALPDSAPEILLGAEVRYYQGIGRLSALKSLRIGQSKLLLLEMPMSVWTEYMIRELIELSGKSSLRIVLAHIDRYMKLQKCSVWDRLFESGILMQANASFFEGFSSRRRALSLLRDGKIHFIGSDCHNLTSRPPMVDRAYDIISRKLGADYVDQMNEYGASMLAMIN